MAGTLAYVAGVGHLLGRETGAPDAPAHLDVSIFEAAMCITEPGPPGALATGVIRPRIGINRFWPTYPTGIYPTRDGWLGVTTVTPSQWQSFCALLDLRELAAEPRYQVSINRLEDADTIDALLAPRLLERTALEWVEAGQAARVPLAIASTPAELFELDQFRERGAWVEAEHPDQGCFPAPGTPFRLHRTPAAGDGRAPCLGEHGGTASGPEMPTRTRVARPRATRVPDRAPVTGPTDGKPAHPVAAHREEMPAGTWVARTRATRKPDRAPVIGRTDGRPAHPVVAHPVAVHPADGANRRPDLLRDIRVVDLTMGWAGPLATRQLADMGAEVIKVESCQYFDWWRGWESTPESIAQKLYEQSTAFNTTGRNKFGITLDLTSRRGKDLLLELVAKSDAVIENYTASVLPKLGLAYERLREANPELVLVSMPPFGASGELDGPSRLRLHRRAGVRPAPHQRPRRRSADDAARRPRRSDRGDQRRRRSGDRAAPSPEDRQRPVCRSLPRRVDVPARRARARRAGDPGRAAGTPRGTSSAPRALGGLPLHRRGALDRDHDRDGRAVAAAQRGARDRRRRPPLRGRAGPEEA